MLEAMKFAKGFANRLLLVPTTLAGIAADEIFEEVAAMRQPDQVLYTLPS